MQPEAHNERWEAALRAVARCVQVWREAHSKATLTETEAVAPARQPTVVNGRPTADHLWKRSFFPQPNPAKL
jgi:hypothetical protein